jgi:hypothetical protein
MRAEGDGNRPHWLKRTKRETAMIPEPVLVRCIANCLETSRYYANKGNRPLADWWGDRAKVFACRLANEPKFDEAPDKKRTVEDTGASAGHASP